MIFNIRPAAERGHAKLDWLNSKHTFSFGNYWDPAHLGFGVLRVINEDRIAPGAGFPPHAHRDMEILSYVLSGALEHKDSMGNGSVILPGQVQYMSAGEGITHSEYNGLNDETTHFYQLWIVANVRGGAPRYAQHPIDPNNHDNRFGVLAGGARFQAPIDIRQDASLAMAAMKKGRELEHVLAADRQYWLQVMRGSIAVRPELPSFAVSASPETALSEGDGVAIAELERLHLTASTDAELLLFDLPKTA